MTPFWSLVATGKTVSWSHHHTFVYSIFEAPPKILGALGFTLISPFTAVCACGANSLDNFVHHAFWFPGYLTTQAWRVALDDLAVDCAKVNAAREELEREINQRRERTGQAEPPTSQ